MLTLHSNFDELSKEVLRTKYSRLLVTLDVVIAVLASLMMSIGIIEVSSVQSNPIRALVII